jgi:hypothetical protein
MKNTFIVSKIFFCASIYFWLIETIVFLVIDGWHWRPIRDSEVLCDSISVLLLQVSLLTFCLKVYSIFDKNYTEK